MITELIRDGEITEEFKTFALVYTIWFLTIIACAYRKKLYLATFGENARWTLNNSTIPTLIDDIMCLAYVPYAEFVGGAIPGLYISLVILIRGISDTNDILSIYKIRREGIAQDWQGQEGDGTRITWKIQIVMYSALIALLALKYWMNK